MKHIYNIILICLVPMMLSCGTAARLKKADTVYASGGYDKAANLYRKVAPKIKDKDKKSSVYFKAGEAFRKSGNSSMASRNYEQAIRNKYPAPEVFIYASEMALINNDMEKSQKHLQTFIELEPENQRGKKLQKSIDMILANTPPKLYKVENMKEFNSRYHDFAPAFGTSDCETVVFTSSRREGKGKTKTYEVTGQKNTDIFKTTLSKKGWTAPEPLDNSVNTSDEEGAAIFNYNYTTLYFTRCVQEKGERFGCSIMLAKPQGDSWTEPENLKLVADSMVAAHPALSADGLTMYFCSNILGGFGGSDLWKVSRGSEDDNLWSEPVNLGATVNTAGEELFPTVCRDTLHFASNGHPGYGGLDIYKAWQNSDGIWTVENMGAPINSNADDFGIIFENDNERGYFCSRRKGGRGGDDIYSFMLDVPVVEYQLQGTIRAAGKNLRLARAEVILNGSDGSTLKRVTEKDGSFQFRLSKNTEYMMIARRDGYFAKKSDKISTEGLTESKTFTVDISMTPHTELIEIPNIFFEFGKADLSVESTAALDSLITLMNENPKIIVQLIAHTDNRGSDDANTNLSQRRAQAVVDYLIINGIDDMRLSAKGMGESQPRKITAEIAAKYPFLQQGQMLNENYINSLQNNEEKEICHALNRRTEIQVVSDNFEQQ